MDGKIYVMDGDTLHSLSETKYDAEKKLQKLLRDHPDLLAGEQMSDSEPRRWILVDREFGISDDEVSTGRWSLDHLFLDQDGVPTLVEVKRSENREIRRQVVGQMMDYAANAVRYGDIHRIRRLFHEKHDDADETLKKRLNVSDPDTYWETVHENLDRGQVRIVFVADRIPSELRGIVEFLNGQMVPAEVLAVEVTQYAGEDLKTLVPRLIGQTAAAEQKKGSQKTTWNENTFFEEVSNRTSEKVAERIRSVYDHALEKGCPVEWREGDSLGGVFLEAGDHRLFKFTVEGKLWTSSLYFADFLDSDDWDQFLDRTQRLGLEFPKDQSEHKQPMRSLEEVEEGWWDEFKAVFEWVREKAESHSS